MDAIEGFLAQIAEVWELGVFGIKFGPITAAFLILVISFVARGVFSRLVLGSLKALTKRTKSDFDDLLLDSIEPPVKFLFVVAGLYFVIEFLIEDEGFEVVGFRVIRSLIAFTIFWAIYRVLTPMSLVIGQFLVRVGNPTAQQALGDFLVKLLKFVVIALGAAAVLQEWGFNVAAVLGGLGLVGMAVALGARDMIANLFSGAMIFLNHLFERGDWIKTASLEGVVEDIGLLATRVRQFDKAQITVQNSHLTGEPIVNYSRMTNRRIYWVIGLEYRTTQDQLRGVVEDIRTYVTESESFETDPNKVPTLVYVDSFNDSSIDIMLYCFTKTTKWQEWLDIKQELALKVKEIVEGHGTGFAFPSTSIYVETMPGGAPEAFPAAEISSKN